MRYFILSYGIFTEVVAMDFCWRQSGKLRRQRQFAMPSARSLASLVKRNLFVRTG